MLFTARTEAFAGVERDFGFLDEKFTEFSLGFKTKCAAVKPHEIGGIRQVGLNGRNTGAEEFDSKFEILFHIGSDLFTVIVAFSPGGGKGGLTEDGTIGLARSEFSLELGIEFRVLGSQRRSAQTCSIEGFGRT